MGTENAHPQPPAEELSDSGGRGAGEADTNGVFDYDVIVVGSGFGGSVSALRLTEKGYRVGILEAGRRYTPDTLPKNSWDLKNFLWLPPWACTASSASTCCATS